MKPDNADVLEQEPDLGGYWLFKAIDKILIIFDMPLMRVSFTLTVSEEGLSVALPLSYLFAFSIDVNQDYEQDEWSLTGHYYDSDLNGIIHTVWSPGA